MSRAEQYSWASLAALAAVFWWFQMRMLDGWTVVEQSAAALFAVYVVVIIASIALEVAIAVILSPGKEIEKDERDHAIEARANQNERLFLIISVNVLVFHLLADAAFAGHVLPSIDMTNHATLFFLLFSLLFIAEAIKRLSTIALYRAQTPRE